MSFNVRDDNATLGPNASVEMPNGATGQAAFKLQLCEPAVFNLQSPAASKEYCVALMPPAATSASNILPLGTQYQVVGVSAVWGVASSSLNVNIEKCTSGTADGSGTNILVNNINTAQTAATPQAYALSTNIDILYMNVTDRLNVVTNGGTAGSIANLTVVVFITRTQ